MSSRGVVQRWEEWQLHILSIGSLVLQWFLFFSAASRKFQIRGWFRFFIWLSYLGSDALAIYALATLFNRHKQLASDSSTAPAPAPADFAGAGNGGTSHVLQVLWAPVLLIHLAGQDTITAYNVEDNELWTRHIITVGSQASVAVYVFCKSWSGEKRLLQAAILLFVAGFLRCSEKPWALYRASVNSLQVSPRPPAGSIVVSAWFRRNEETYRRFVSSILKKMLGTQVAALLRIEEEEADKDGEGEGGQEWGSHVMPLEDYIEQARRFCQAFADDRAAEQLQGDLQNHEEEDGEKKKKKKQEEEEEDGKKKKQEEELEKALPHLPTEPRELFLDLALPYARRLPILQSFSRLDGACAIRVLQAGLSNTFDLLYTKERVFQTDYGVLVRVVGLILNFTALGLFSRSYKQHGYDKKDVTVTFVLLAGTAALETMAFIRRSFLNNDTFPRSSRVLSNPPENISNARIAVPLLNRLRKQAEVIGKRAVEAIQTRLNIQSIGIAWAALRMGFYFDHWIRKPRWSETVAQYNLLDFFIRSTRPGMVLMVARCFGCQDYLDRTLYVESRPSSQRITERVLQYVKHGWEEYIHDADTYRRFNSRRGQWTLEPEEYRQLGWSVLQRQFDESVLLWHVATDLCFRQLGHQQPDQGSLQTRCREMSNYMVYLLFVKPEMLLAGTRRHLFTAACSELERLFLHNQNGNGKPPLDDDPELCREFFARAAAAADPGTFVHNAWILANALMRLGGDKMWEVMEGVWVEMLCYSAARCRGYLHAKSLGAGGEYLSYVWLLLSYMGMESLADRFQQPEPTTQGRQEDDALAAGTSASQSHESEICPV